MSFSMNAEAARISLENYIEAEAVLLRADGQVYVQFPSAERLEIVPIDDMLFEQWLTQYCIESGLLQGMRQAIKLVIASAKAKYWIRSDPIGVRVGAANPSRELYWDLADKTGRAVYVNGSWLEGSSRPGSGVSVPS